MDTFFRKLPRFLADICPEEGTVWFRKLTARDFFGNIQFSDMPASKHPYSRAPIQEVTLITLA